MNSNFWKYALPLIATVVAATVGILMQPPPAVPSTPQTIAGSTRTSASRAAADECGPQAGKPSSGTPPPDLEDWLHDCRERAR